MHRIFAALALILAASLASAQTRCSVAQPCAQLLGSDNSCAAAVTPAAGGALTETAGPCTISVWRCTGTMSTCSNTTNLAAAPWSMIGTVTWTASSGAYYDATVAYSTASGAVSYCYYLTASWATGNPSGPSAIIEIDMPLAPAITPAAVTLKAVNLLQVGDYPQP